MGQWPSEIDDCGASLNERKIKAMHHFSKCGYYQEDTVTCGWASRYYKESQR